MQLYPDPPHCHSHDPRRGATLYRPDTVSASAPLVSFHQPRSRPAPSHQGPAYPGFAAPELPKESLHSAEFVLRQLSSPIWARRTGHAVHRSCGHHYRHLLSSLGDLLAERIASRHPVQPTEASARLYSPKDRDDVVLARSHSEESVWHPASGVHCREPRGCFRLSPSEESASLLAATLTLSDELEAYGNDTCTTHASNCGRHPVRHRRSRSLSHRVLTVVSAHHHD